MAFHFVHSGGDAPETARNGFVACHSVRAEMIAQ